MKQYQKNIKTFYLQVLFTDFDKKLHPGMCVVDELCNIKLSSLLKKKINKLGIIFNSEYSRSTRITWVARRFKARHIKLF